ncbi:hypothetical protein [Ehrlichia canis]|uniref:hypothetical protein n=1 Tax=Ehrlichia canis TaxID=944 RepID=UPI000C82D95C|nr:hypothetical protein [Ehrlichia canis]AUO54509.1 hypothetical protein C1I72_01140 [Ehrlichia canis]UKC53837.1 hypothetical protein s20019040002_000882 [Ehrlichia canis]UKC54772.1 hypothetical protein s20026770001_000881 [Ehrlichia canis]UKC55709.1 hypothetical protein s21009500007_000881 [Ehrlichia canis]
MHQPVEVKVYSKAEQDKRLIENQAIIKNLKLEQDLLLKKLAKYKEDKACLLSEIQLLQQALETERLNGMQSARNLIESKGCGQILQYMR